MSKLSDQCCCCKCKGETCRFKLDVCFSLPFGTQNSCNNPCKSVQTKTCHLSSSGQDDNDQPCDTGSISVTPSLLMCSHGCNCDNRTTIQANIDCANSGGMVNEEHGSQINRSGEAKSNNNYLQTLEIATNDLLNVIGQINQITQNDDSLESLSSLQSRLSLVHTNLVNPTISGEVQNSRSYIGRSRNSVTFNNITRNNSGIQIEKADVRTLYRNRVEHPKVSSDRKCECPQQCMCATRATREATLLPVEFQSSSGYQANQSGHEATNQSRRLSNVGSPHYINANQSANNEIIANQAVHIGAANNTINNRSVCNEKVCQITNNAPVQSTAIQNNNATFVTHKNHSPIDQPNGQAANSVTFPRSNTNRSVPNQMIKNKTFQIDGTINDEFYEDITDSSLQIIDIDDEVDEITINGSASEQHSANKSGLECQVGGSGRNQAVSQAINNAGHQVGGSINRSATNQAASPAIHTATFEVVGSQVGGIADRSRKNQLHFQTINNGTFQQYANQSGMGSQVGGHVNQSVRHQSVYPAINSASCERSTNKSERSVGKQSASPVSDNAMFITSANQSGMTSQMDESMNRSKRNQGPSHTINNASYRLPAFNEAPFVTSANQSGMTYQVDGSVKRPIRIQAPSQGNNNASYRQYVDQSGIGGQIGGFMNQSVGHQSASPAINTSKLETSANNSEIGNQDDGPANLSYQVINNAEYAQYNPSASPAFNNASFETSANNCGTGDQIFELINNNEYVQYVNQSGIGSQASEFMKRSVGNQSASPAINYALFERSANQSGIASQMDESLNRSVKNQSSSQAINNTTVQQYSNQSSNRSGRNQADSSGAYNPKTNIQGDGPVITTFQEINNGTFQSPANQSGRENQVVGKVNPFRFQTVRNLPPSHPIYNDEDIILQPSNNNLPQNQNQTTSISLPTGAVNRSEIVEFPNEFQTADTFQAVYDVIQEAFDSEPFDLGIVQNFFNMIFGLKGILSWNDLVLIIIDNIAKFTTVKVFNRQTLYDMGHFNLDPLEMEEVYKSGLLDLFEVIRNRNTLQSPYAAEQLTPSTVRQIMAEEDDPDKKSEEFLPDIDLQYYMNCSLLQDPTYFSFSENDLFL